MIRRAALVIVAVALLAAAPRDADAHPPPFFWMEDLSTDRRVGFEVLGGPSDLIGDAAVVGGSVFAHLSLSEHFTLTGRVPFAYADYEIAGVEDDGLALGNLSLGGQLSNAGHYHGSDERALLGLTARVYLPTASDEGSSGVAADLASAYFIPDPGRYLVDTTTLRLRGDFRYEVGQIFFQAEGALDFFFVDEGEDVLGALIGLGAGVSLSPYLALLGELNTVTDILEDDEGENFLHTLDLGIRYHDAGLMLGARLYVPLDERLRDADVLGLGVDLAARF